MQGVGAEIVLALFLYRVWKLPVVMLAGAATGLALGLNDAFRYYAGATASFQVTYVICAIISGVVVSGIGSWLLVRALARTGVLSSFAAGREHGRRPRSSAA
ncbi:ECF transporter S component [Curtobacterium sp. MCPF17_052]|uniref:ECF transporter S component n=1 Tax=Curtobacterium sp. MCPF17_052 TaxID=2175655 RepID=UPI0024DFC08B|nr:ECF transporter S component [Curtobacterium sp. MCPF17_052]WIB13990.1 ECF transporter S component [Curtobacterium sp. MCPF17_052]